MIRHEPRGNGAKEHAPGQKEGIVQPAREMFRENGRHRIEYSGCHRPDQAGPGNGKRIQMPAGDQQKGPQNGHAHSDGRTGLRQARF